MICLPSERALQPMQGCTEESMELWLIPALVIHFLACSDLITSVSADSAGGPAQSGQPEVLHSPHSFLPRTPSSSALQVRKTATPPGGLLAPLWSGSTSSSRATKLYPQRPLLVTSCEPFGVAEDSLACLLICPRRHCFSVCRCPIFPSTLQERRHSRKLKIRPLEPPVSPDPTLYSAGDLMQAVMNPHGWATLLPQALVYSSSSW